MLASIWYPSTLLIHEIQLNEGYSTVITNLKCNLVNFEIPNRFLYSMELSIWNLKIDKITFQMMHYYEKYSYISRAGYICTKLHKPLALTSPFLALGSPELFPGGCHPDTFSICNIIGGM